MFDHWVELGKPIYYSAYVGLRQLCRLSDRWQLEANEDDREEREEEEEESSLPSRIRLDTDGAGLKHLP